MGKTHNAENPNIFIRIAPTPIPTQWFILRSMLLVVKFREICPKWPDNRAIPPFMYVSQRNIKRCEIIDTCIATFA